jgi:protein-tyrosine-phosphatase
LPPGIGMIGEGLCGAAAQRLAWASKSWWIAGLSAVGLPFPAIGHLPQEASAEGQKFSDRPHAVLFACNMNAIRSPMAAAILRFLAGKQIYVQSAGVRAGEIDPFAVAAMEEIGIDIGKHRPATIEDLEDTTFDLIVTLAPEAHHKALEMTRTMAAQVEYWPTMDPSAAAGNREQILDAYRAVRDQLFEKIKARFAFATAPQA